MRIGLVFVPGNQMSLDALCPKTSLFMLAGMLRNSGIPVDCMDFGGLDSFQNYPRASVVADQQGAWNRFWNRNTHDSDAREADVSAFGMQEISETAEVYGCRLLESAPGLIAWYVETREEFCMAKAVSAYVRRHSPQTHQTLLGPYIARFGAFAMSKFPTLDTGITADMPTALAMLYEYIDAPESWGRIPGLIFRNRSGLACSPRNIHPKRETEPQALGMFSDALEVARQQGRFALYPVAFAHDFFLGCGCRPGALRPIQKSASCLLDEMCALNDRCDAGVFHIEAPHVSVATFERFADTLLARNFMILYSLGGLTEPFDAGLAERLFASGCRAVGFHAPSGSQRLLEDFYGCDMSISAMRATLRHRRAAGLFTVVHLKYPCPRDDYHTRAETELFLEACSPDGVFISAPELTPDSLWFMRASEYGFVVNHRAFQQWASCSGTDGSGQPYRMFGWKNGRAGEARGALEESARKLGCITGITERHGLLARIVRSVMDESEFLERLQCALERNDATQLSLLMACVNETLDTLCTDAVPAGMAADAF